MLYVLCTVFLEQCKLEKENINNVIRKKNIFTVLQVFIGKHLCITAPAQFRPVLFKGQLHTH